MTIEDEILLDIDPVALSDDSRSAYIVRVLRAYFRRRARRARDAHDLERFNAAAHRLNAEMRAVLELQSPSPNQE